MTREIEWEIWGDSGLQMVKSAGEIDPRAHMEALAAAGEALTSAVVAPPAQVVFYDAARLVLTPEQMADNVLRAAMVLGPVTLPTALVVAPDQLEHWRVYSAIMGSRGILRGVFTGAGAATRAGAWAARMASVTQGQRPALQPSWPAGSAALRTSSAASGR